MDKDSKLIFESYQNSQLLNESFWRRMFRGSTTIFPKGTGAQMDNILNNLAAKIVKTGANNPNFFTQLNQELSQSVVDILQTLTAPARMAGDTTTLGYLKSIATKFESTIVEFDNVGKELGKIDRSKIESLIKITEDSLDETKQLFEGYANSKTINPTFSEKSKEALTYLNELEKSLQKTNKILKGDKSLLGKGLDALKAHWIIATLTILSGVGAVGAGEAAGYGIVSLLKGFVGSMIDGLVGMFKGGVEAMKEGEEPATRGATLAPTTTPEATSASGNTSEVSFDQYFQPSPTRR